MKANKAYWKLFRRVLMAVENLRPIDAACIASRFEQWWSRVGKSYYA